MAFAYNLGTVFSMADVRFIRRSSINSYSTSTNVSLSTSFPGGTQFIDLHLPGGNHFYMQNGTRFTVSIMKQTFCT